ncbi:multicopper polyphenol oxidase [Halarcobacter ebronensis]|uniref:Purine nucleoside phosphorylase n=1 Tax=Halarcobacter ebronensis TaxID=1462615 RepID=A0A4Q0YIJ4_9BACT|nr:peptidoglycan editing factor PgeF [Halarcobacter ebronensis]QKF82183.1 multi-copper polyphenol oxidoreductase laccase [Halarcobacter ebronensis]RXJ70105.1 multicopper polyphenol oxidase [Halarcobacter ebronensis]RXK03439.1 multicopper polyphenol oxidase [Halarcobacter ebronensis]
MYDIFYTFTNKDEGNIAYHVPDKKENVDKNRLELANKFSFDIKKLISMNQVHGDNIVIVDENSPNIIDKCDAIITDKKGLTLMVMVADCIPILMFDKFKGVIAAVHAGRNSTFQNIAKKTALKMRDEFGSILENIEVVMGPSIQKCCYEVDEKLANIVKTSFGIEFENNRYIDLQGINRKQLSDIDVTNINITNICTKCSGVNFFSYRIDKNCGRFAGIISILS